MIFCRPATLIWHKIWMNVRKNLNVQKRIWIWLPKYNFYMEIPTRFKGKKKNLNLESGYLNLTKFQDKNLND